MSCNKSSFFLLIGYNLREIRINKGVAIEDLSYVSGISTRQIIRIEFGQINTGIFQVYRIAHALDISSYEAFP